MQYRMDLKKGISMSSSVALIDHDASLIANLKQRSEDHVAALAKIKRYRMDKTILFERMLELAGFGDLVSHSNITEIAGDISESVTALDALEKAACCLKEYQEFLALNPGRYSYSPMRLDLLLRTILQDHPEAIEELRSYGALP